MNHPTLVKGHDFQKVSKEELMKIPIRKRSKHVYNREPKILDILHLKNNGIWHIGKKVYFCAGLGKFHSVPVADLLYDAVCPDRLISDGDTDLKYVPNAKDFVSCGKSEILQRGFHSDEVHCGVDFPPVWLINSGLLATFYGRRMLRTSSFKQLKETLCAYNFGEIGPTLMRLMRESMHRPGRKVMLQWLLTEGTQRVKTFPIMSLAFTKDVLRETGRYRLARIGPELYSDARNEVLEWTFQVYADSITNSMQLSYSSDGTLVKRAKGWALRENQYDDNFVKMFIYACRGQSEIVKTLMGQLDLFWSSELEAEVCVGCPRAFFFPPGKDELLAGSDEFFHCGLWGQKALDFEADGKKGRINKVYPMVTPFPNFAGNIYINEVMPPSLKRKWKFLGKNLPEPDFGLPIKSIRDSVFDILRPSTWVYNNPLRFLRRFLVDLISAILSKIPLINLIHKKLQSFQPKDEEDEPKTLAEELERSRRWSQTVWRGICDADGKTTFLHALLENGDAALFGNRIAQTVINYKWNFVKKYFRFEMYLYLCLLFNNVFILPVFLQAQSTNLIESVVGVYDDDFDKEYPPEFLGRGGYTALPMVDRVFLQDTSARSTQDMAVDIGFCVSVLLNMLMFLRNLGFILGLIRIRGLSYFLKNIWVVYQFFTLSIFCMASVFWTHANFVLPYVWSEKEDSIMLPDGVTPLAGRRYSEKTIESMDEYLGMTRVTLAIANYFGTFGLLYYLRGSTKYGTLISMIIHILSEIKHFLFLVVLSAVATWSATYLLLATRDDPLAELTGDGTLENFGFSVLTEREISETSYELVKASFWNWTQHQWHLALHTVRLVIFADTENFDNLVAGRYRFILEVFFLVNAVIVTIVLFNMLIAILSHVYEEVEGRSELESMKVRADIVLTLESQYNFEHDDTRIFPRFIHVAMAKNQSASPTTRRRGGYFSHIMGELDATRKELHAQHEEDAFAAKLARQAESVMMKKLNDIEKRLEKRNFKL